MMPEPLIELMKQDGRLIFDSRAPALYYHSKGTAYTFDNAALVSNMGIKGVDISVPSDLKAIVAFRCPHEVVPVRVNGDTREYMVNTTSDGVPVHYYIFTLAGEVPSAGEVNYTLYNQAGEVTFVLNPYLAIIISGTGPVTIPGGKQYAASLGSYVGRRFQLHGQIPPPPTYPQDAWATGSYAGKLVGGVPMAGFDEFQYQNALPTAFAPNNVLNNVGFKTGLIIDVTPYA